MSGLPGLLCRLPCAPALARPSWSSSWAAQTSPMVCSALEVSVGSIAHVQIYYCQLFKGTKVLAARGRHKKTHSNICDENAEKWSVRLCCVSGCTAPQRWAVFSLTVSLGSVPAVNAHGAQQYTHSLRLLQLKIWPLELISRVAEARTKAGIEANFKPLMWSCPVLLVLGGVPVLGSSWRGSEEPKAAVPAASLPPTHVGTAALCQGTLRMFCTWQHPLGKSQAYSQIPYPESCQQMFLCRHHLGCRREYGKPRFLSCSNEAFFVVSVLFLGLLTRKQIQPCAD